jgi:hypothetical protein
MAVSTFEDWKKFDNTYVRRYFEDKRQLRIFVDQGDLRISLEVLTETGWKVLHVSMYQAATPPPLNSMMEYADTLFR